MYDFQRNNKSNKPMSSNEVNVYIYKQPYSFQQCEQPILNVSSYIVTLILVYHVYGELKCVL